MHKADRTLIKFYCYSYIPLSYLEIWHYTHAIVRFVSPQLLLQFSRKRFETCSKVRIVQAGNGHKGHMTLIKFLLLGLHTLNLLRKFAIFVLFFV